MASQKKNAPVGLLQQQLRFPGFVENYVLAGAAKAVTVPSWAVWAWIKPSATITVNMNITAAAIAADTGSGGGAPASGEGHFPIEPADGYANLFIVKGMTSFSIFGTATVAVALYGDESVI